MAITTYLLSTSNKKELKLQSKDRMVEWLKKQDLYIGCLKQTHFRLRNTHTKMRWNKISRDGPRGQYISGISQRKTNAMIVQIREI